MDIYRDFMALPGVFELSWAGLRNQMAGAGIKNPRLAMTELQMFATLGDKAGNAPASLTLSNLVDPGTLGEALYDVLYYHAAVQLLPFVEIVTHSATVNHGGGLRKARTSLCQPLPLCAGGVRRLCRRDTGAH